MLTIQAYAKINLTMDVLRRRGDGYHDVDLLMQSVSLCDTLALRPADALSLRIKGDLPASVDNLVLRAARALQEAAGVSQGADMALEKRIPVAAGLGGGSADAAAALVGLNTLWGLGLPVPSLLEIGAKLGADVPFCIVGGLARATGIGCDVQPLTSALPLHMVIVKPCEGLLTRDVFCALQLNASTRHPDTEGAIRAMRLGSLDALCTCMGNVLEPVSAAVRPEIERAIARLRELNACQARMSGSGPAVFGLFANQRDAACAQAALIEEGHAAIYARDMPCGVEIMD